MWPRRARNEANYREEDSSGLGSGLVVPGQACRLVKLQQESEAGCLRFNRISYCIERICKFAKGRVCRHVSDYPSLAAIAMLGNLDKLVRREAQPGLARMAREGHGFNVSQSENDPALNGHNDVTLRAMDSVLLLELNQGAGVFFGNSAIESLMNSR
jgi:hypothetical protein